MSVNNQTFHLLRAQVVTTRSSIASQLQTFQSYMSEMEQTFLSTISTCTAHHQQEVSRLHSTLATLTSEVLITKQMNEQLLKKSRTDESALLRMKESYEALDGAFKELQKENQYKQQRVRELVAEVEGIKVYMKELKEMQEKENVVDFDEGDAAACDRLDTINEVSEHDLSITMSMKSFKSEMLEEIINSSMTEETQNNIPLKSADYQIEDYHDALQILKNYNNGVGAGMSKKGKADYSDVKENIPTFGGNVPAQSQAKCKKNDTIAKIKKMRKIQNLDIESGYVVKSEKKPFGVISLNQQESDSSLSKDSKLSAKDQSLSRVSCGRASIREDSSDRLRSRVREELASLKQPVAAVNRVLEQIAGACRYSLKVERLRESICVISYAGGLYYRGHCDAQDRPDGFGKLMVKSQVVYQGEWRQGRLHGWGKLILLPFLKGADKAIIEVEGNFRMGVIEGTVVCLFNSGEKFMGVMRRGAIEQEGTFIGQSGILTGQWQGSSLLVLI